MNEEQESMATQPQAEHEWLQNLIGNWKTVSHMKMGPESEPMISEGTESVASLGGLWAYGKGKGSMPNGGDMEWVSALGYDVSFKEYRGCWFASASSHLWKYVGKLSADGKTMTLTCEGPDMVNEGETATYIDEIELVDENSRTMTSYGLDENGQRVEFMKVFYTRA